MLRRPAAALIVGFVFSPLPLAYGSSTASNATFGALIRAKIATDGPQCVAFFQREVGKDGKTLAQFKPADATGSFFQSYKDMVSLGWATIRTSTVSEAVPYLPHLRTTSKRLDVILTPKGQAVVAEHGGDLCYGRMAFVRVDNFTVPATTQGVTYSRVNFTYHLTDLAPWTRKLALMDRVLPLTRFNAQEQRRSGIDAVLYSDGWHTEGPFGRAR